MSDQVEIRPLSSADVPEIVNLWNSVLIAHPITEARFNSLFFSDVTGIPNLKHGSFIAKSDRIIGFVIAVSRNIPAPGLGLEPDLGYLSAIAVAPAWQQQGIGSRLIAHAIGELAVNEMLVSGRTGSAPAAVFPGVDLDNYATAVDFLLKNNFQQVAQANSMSRAITQAMPIELADGVSLVTDIDVGKLQEFIATAFPGDWADVALAKLAANPTEFAVVAVNDNYAGFAVWNQGWFGPIGVSESYRNYGLGKLLVLNAINQMHSAGVDRIWFNWADEWVVPFYQKLGFEITRRYQRMNWQA